MEWRLFTKEVLIYKAMYKKVEKHKVYNDKKTSKQTKIKEYKISTKHNSIDTFCFECKRD